MCSLHLVYATRSQNILRFFFFNDTATPEIYTLSLHDALPIFSARPDEAACRRLRCWRRVDMRRKDRKSTRLNSSHVSTSYAAFCLKKKNKYLTNVPSILRQFSSYKASVFDRIVSLCRKVAN